LSPHGTPRLLPPATLDAPSAQPDLLSSQTNAMDDAALIGLDWGSSHLRAYLLRADGTLVEARSSDAGASRLAVGTAPAERAALFERHLRELIADWLVPGRPMIACGMVGSAHGWREAAYVPCPVDLNEVHRHLSLVRGSDGLELHIVPGVSHRPSGHAPDVMRGEETQVIGVLARDSTWAAGSSIVLPGTHSKWVRIVDGKLVSFATWMTGELFDILRSHSVLSRSLADSSDLDAEAFERGIAASRDARGSDLSHLLFGVRTLHLFGERTPRALADYLSGLLIGHELASGLARSPAELPLVLVGDERLCIRYQLALQGFGRRASAVVVDSVASGLAVIARSCGLIQGRGPRSSPR
jgi:2-dehydro-3-deoxygalactonokinase